MTRTCLMLSTAFVLFSAGTRPAMAADHRFSITAQDLGTALRQFAAQSGEPIVVSSALVAGRHSGGAQGALSSETALNRLLSGTGLHADLIDGAFVIRAKDGGAHSQAVDPGIVVTGTRIRGAVPIGSAVTTLDRAAIARSRRATVSEILQTLPQNFAGGPNEASVGTNARNGANTNQAYGSSINLRGLGAQSTLVLLDGFRPALGGYQGTFVDTSLIPTIAIDRIEIVSDGASAIYGTDAVAGVVNMRLRNRLDGFETQIFSGTAGGAAGQRQIAQAAGKRWSSGGIMLAYQFDRRDRLSGTDRSIATEDLSRWGGPDLRSTFARPGNIIGADGSIYAIPGGQNGRNLTASELIAGAGNRFDRDKVIDLLPSQTTHSLYAAADQTLLPGLSSFAQLLYARRRFDEKTSPVFLSQATVPVTNPFYVDPDGTGQPIGVRYDLGSEIGLLTQSGTVSALTASGGLRGRIGTWSIEASGSWSRETEISRNTNLTSDTRIADALADTDPATALNLFGDGTANNPATLAFIRAYDNLHSRYTLWSANLRADGSLLTLPAGAIKLAAGYEHRDETIRSTETYNFYTATPDAAEVDAVEGSPGHRRIDAVYGELSIPVLGPRTDRLPGRLDLSVAGRVDRYSDVGRTTNPKIGVRWEPLSGLAFRGSFGTSFRAPSFGENPGTAQNNVEPVRIDDPQSATGQTAVIGLNGNAPDIRPEKARTWNGGVDFRPRPVPGLSLGASYYAIAYRDRIGFASPDYQQFLERRDIYGSLTQEHPDAATIAALYADPRFSNPDGIAATEIGAIIDLRMRNLSRVTMRGLDLTMAYDHALFGGTGHFDFAGTRIFSITQRLTAGAPKVEMLGKIFSPVDFRARGTLGWSRAGAGIGLTANYVAGYRNTLVIPDAHVSSWTTFDGQLRYSWAKASPLGGATVSLNAVNLFNRRPPYVQTVVFDRVQSYDPGQANVLGRQISLQLAMSW